jgi:hypothetical protein
MRYTSVDSQDEVDIEKDWGILANYACRLF